MKNPNSSDSAASLIKEAKEYVDTRLDYARLAAVDKTADWSGGLMAVTVCALVAIGLVLVLSYAFACFLSSQLDSPAAGFFAVGGFYLVLFIIFYVFRNRLIRSRLTNVLIRKALQ